MIVTTAWRIPEWGDATIIEAIWLLSGVLATMFALKHIRPLYHDLRVARLSKRPVLTAVAAGYFRREVIRLMQGLCLVSVGVYAVFIPNPIPGHAVVTPTGLVLTAALFSVSILISVQSIWDWRTRHIVQKLVEEGKNGH